MSRCAAALLFLLPGLVGAQDQLAPKMRAALVKLRVTTQDYRLDQPWNKGEPRTRECYGVLIAPGLVLTPAANVEHELMIEVSVANSSRRYPAALKHVDPDVGLAEVSLTDPALVKKLAPLEIGDPVRLDDTFDIYELGSDNVMERGTGRVVRADAEAQRLTLRLKTTISEAGTGQPAIRQGKIVGLLIHTNTSKQEGTLLSVETIRHYLDGFKDGHFKGIPGGGFFVQHLLRDDLRAYYGVGPNQHGIAVTRVIPGRTGDGILQPGDVILKAGGYDLDDEGKFVDAVHGRLDASYLFRGKNYAGDTLKATILRKGKVQDVEIPLKAWPSSEKRVPQSYVGSRPPYMVVAGLVILELTQDLAHSVSRSPGGVILRRYAERSEWDPPSARKRIVYVDRVFGDPATKGFEDLSDAPIETVNGKPIHQIADIVAALKTPLGDYDVFHFEGLESDFAVAAASLQGIDERIAKNYRIPRLQYLPDSKD